LPTAADILKESGKRRSVGFLGSVYGEMKQLIPSVGSGMGYFVIQYALNQGVKNNI